MTHEQASHSGENFWDLLFGGSIALIAAFLAINDLGGGKYGDDELQLANDKTSAYTWYQSKGIKESLAEGQRDLGKMLLSSGSIAPEQRPALEKMTEDLNSKIARYKKEKAEILLGSQAVGKENWTQDVDGVMGKVTGAKEVEARQGVLSDAGDRFDVANLFLQLSIVMGAIGILIKKNTHKKVFYIATVGLGVVGLTVSVFAYMKAFSAG